MREHITFLESMIMSAAVVDKKYRDGIPGCVESIDILDHSADDARQEAEKTKKRKTSRKIKPGKNGLYPLEDILIRRWWAGYDDEAESEAPGTSREDIAKNRIAQLRIRETQLQMIIILEVLALQPLALVSEDIGGSLPTTLPPNTGCGGKDKAAKSKMPEHLSMLIDVHIDRLCIWQSIALEAVKAPVDSGSSQSEKPRGSATSSIHADNMLRDFCVEVIVPL
jgi:DNA replication regulator SLD3